MGENRQPGSRLEKEEKRIVTENRRLEAVISFERGLSLERLTYRGTGENPVRMSRGRDLFSLEIRGRRLSPEDFRLVSVERAEDQNQELVTFLMENEEEKLKLRFHLMNDRRDSITLLWQVWDGFKNGVPQEIFMSLPFLAGLSTGSEDEKIYYPACTLGGRRGDVLKRPPESFYSSDMKMPLVLCEQKGMGSGLCIQFLSQSDLSDEGAVQNVSIRLLETLTDRDSLLKHRIAIHPDASFNDTLELKITGIENGWPEAFGLCRRDWQSGYDLSEYEKEELGWMKTCVVNHFAFLYGSEAFDFERQQVDVDRLLEQGEEFGGYDTVTVWNQYPRLGVDQRNQWEFYDDFPGGREALRRMVDQFHEKGVKVLLPYIPWDRGEEESTGTMGNEFARIIRDTGADGYQLDTCKDLPFSFRKKLDEVRPGLLLQTQAHPYKNEPVEFITSSWDEFWYSDPMPETDLFRFMLPQHIAPVISRWLREEDKDVLIKRCMFNAAPIVIWQDIFGRWMPFTGEQKAKIREWKGVYLENREIYQGKAPVPLYPVSGEGIYCNLFLDNREEQRIFALYNDRDEDVRLEFSDVCGRMFLTTADTKGIKEEEQRRDVPERGIHLILDDTGNGFLSHIRPDAFCLYLPAKGVSHVRIRGGCGREKDGRNTVQ